MLQLLLLLIATVPVFSINVDPNGYIAFCPCMGRFGNQAEHYLGSVSFARGLNRTLILPPWVEYHSNSRKSVQVPFDKYFKVEPLAKFTKVITMEKFMKELAPVIWPPDKRVALCYMARHGPKENDCNAKDGNPFGSFWDTFNIDFIASEFYGGLPYNIHSVEDRHHWSARFPSSSHLVLAFTGAPASFPATQEDIYIQKYFQWSDGINSLAERFIAENIVNRPFLGIHMRNGQDWENACQHASGPHRHLFGSANCLGAQFEHGSLTKELCLPPKAIVITQVKQAVKNMSASTVFIAADSDFMIPQFQKAMPQVNFVRLTHLSPHVELAILGKADHYIGNCISTFSAFATRERRINKKSVEFWAFPQSSYKSQENEEL